MPSEHLRVQAIYRSPDGISSTMLGYLRSRVDDRLWAVVPEMDNSRTALSFDLSTAIAHKFGDEHSMRAGASFPLRFRFESALSFAFQDDSTLDLFELEDTSTDDLLEPGALTRIVRRFNLHSLHWFEIGSMVLKFMLLWFFPVRADCSVRSSRGQLWIDVG